MWNLASFHTLDLRVRRPLLERARQLLECLRRTRGDHFHGPVAQVAREPAQSPAFGFAQHEPAESHPLDPAVPEKPQRDHAGGPPPPPPCRPCDARRRYHQAYATAMSARIGTTMSTASSSSACGVPAAITSTDPSRRHS